MHKRLNQCCLGWWLR